MDTVGMRNRLFAAIEKLEYLRATSTRGQWVQSNGSVMFAGTFGLSPVLSTHTGARTDAELVATLHRTIDVQLRFLRSATRKIEFAESWGDYTSGMSQALALADAILGDG